MTEKKELGEILGLVSRELPYSYFVAQNSIIAPGVDLLNFVLTDIIADHLPSYKPRAAELRALFYTSLAQIQSDGPRMEDVPIFLDLVKSSVSNKIKEWSEDHPQEMKEIKVRHPYIFGIQNIRADYLFFDFLNQYVLSDLHLDRQTELFSQASSQASSSDCFGMWKNLKGMLTEQELELAHRKYQQWVDREDVKREKGRTFEYSGGGNRVEYFAHFAEVSGLDYHGFDFGARPKGHSDLGHHQFNVIIHKIPLFER